MILAVIAATDARCGEVAVVAVVVDVQDSAEEDQQEVEVLSVSCTNLPPGCVRPAPHPPRTPWLPRHGQGS